MAAVSALTRRARSLRAVGAAAMVVAGLAAARAVANRAGEATRRGRVLARPRVLEPFDRDLLHPRRQQPLNIAHQVTIGCGDERPRAAGEACPARPADTMHVVLGDEWQVEV